MIQKFLIYFVLYYFVRSRSRSRPRSATTQTSIRKDVLKNFSTIWSSFSFFFFKLVKFNDGETIFLVLLSILYRKLKFLYKELMLHSIRSFANR